MSDRILVSTRKGLFVLARDNGAWRTYLVRPAAAFFASRRPTVETLQD